MIKEVDTNSKLSPKAQTFVLQALAEKRRGGEIRTGLKEQFEVEEFSDSAISYYRTHYKSAITRRHRKWTADVESDIDLATKKVRVREYALRYWGFRDSCAGVKTGLFSKEENIVLNDLLEHIRVEMEGKGSVGVGRGTEQEPFVLKVISHVPGE